MGETTPRPVIATRRLMPLPLPEEFPNFKPFQVQIPYWVLDPSSFYYTDGYAT